MLNPIQFSVCIFAIIFSLTSFSGVREVCAAEPMDTAGDSNLSLTQEDRDLTFSKDEVINALQSVGGNIARGSAHLIAEVFKNYGQPSGIILGTEWQVSLFGGYRKGSGSLTFKDSSGKSTQNIYWRAPSIGLNIGASKSQVAVLVYGAKHPSDVLQRFASIEGSYHTLVGAGISYLRSSIDPNDTNVTTLAYITVGVGLDAGVAVESLSFTSRDK